MAFHLVEDLLMQYQERFGTLTNMVTKELDFTGIMYTLDTSCGRIVFADQEILPPKSKLMDEVGGMGVGSAGTHRASKVYKDKVLARGVPLLNWEQITKIFDVSEKEKISLVQATFKVVGKGQFRGDVAAQFEKAQDMHYTAYQGDIVEAPVITTAPNAPRKKLLEKDGAFQTAPG
jgi:hypothetical protein